MGRERKHLKDADKRRWSITTKVEESIECDVTIKVKELLSCPSSVLLFLLAAFSCSWTYFCRDFFLFLLSVWALKVHENVFVPFQLTQRQLHLNSNLRSIATGSWGCGELQAGDAQFKVLIQWLAASVANVPSLIYYTCSRESLSKLDTVVRVLHGESSQRNSFGFWNIKKVFLTLLYPDLDRKWTVGELLRHTLFYAKNILNNPTHNLDKNFCLFDKLIGLEKSNWLKAT